MLELFHAHSGFQALRAYYMSQVLRAYCMPQVLRAYCVSLVLLGLVTPRYSHRDLMSLTMLQKISIVEISVYIMIGEWKRLAGTWGSWWGVRLTCCWVTVPGRSDVELGRGDVVLWLQGGLLLPPLTAACSLLCITDRRFSVALPLLSL